MCSTCQPFELPRAALARTARWSQALQLPSNTKAFQTLMLQRPPENLMHIVDTAVGPYFTTLKAQRVLHRVWGYLLIHEPGLAQVPAAPFAAALGALAFPTSPVFAFELALHHLLNTVPVLYDPECIASLDASLRRRAPALHAHFRALDFPPHQYLGLPVEQGFLPCLRGEEWTKLADAVFTAMDGDAEYARASVALVEALAKPLLKAKSAQEALTILCSRSATFDALRGRMLSLRHSTRVPLAARRILTNPDGSRYLPLLEFIDVPSSASVGTEDATVQSATAVLERILHHEHDVLRERENRLRLLELALADARRNIGPVVVPAVVPPPKLAPHALADGWFPSDGHQASPRRDDDGDGGYDQGHGASPQGSVDATSTSTKHYALPLGEDASPNATPARIPSAGGVGSGGSAAGQQQSASSAFSLRRDTSSIATSPAPRNLLLHASSSSPSPSSASMNAVAGGRVQVVPIYTVRSTTPSVYMTPRDVSSASGSKFLDYSAQRSLSAAGATGSQHRALASPLSAASSTHLPTRWSPSVSSARS